MPAKRGSKPSSMPSHPVPVADSTLTGLCRLLALVLLLVAMPSTAPAAEPSSGAVPYEGWEVLWSDPEGLIAPLDVQLISGIGEEPTQITIFDPGSNAGKIRRYDLDGHPLGIPLLHNGPAPWSSTLLPFSHFDGPQLPLGAYRRGAVEALPTDEGTGGFLRSTEGSPSLQPIGMGIGEATHPGMLSPLPFPVTWWGVDPSSGAVFAAGPDGLYRGTDDFLRMPVQLPNDLLNLEPGPDGTVALFAGPGRDAWDLAVRLVDPEGVDRGQIDIGAQLSGPVTVLDTANLGRDGGFVVLVELAVPYPALLTQYLNDEARGLIKDRERTPFLLRFAWEDGLLAALTPLPDLPEPLTLARVSGDSLTTVLLVRGLSDQFVRILSSGNLGEVGDVPLTLTRQSLELVSVIDSSPVGTLHALDQVNDPGGLVPMLTLKTFAPSMPIERWDLLSLPPGSRFDAGGFGVDPQQRLWWGGQAIDEGGIRGSVWQRWTLDPSPPARGADLFKTLPTDFFNLGTLEPLDRLPYLLAQGVAADGSVLALAGTFDPPESQFLYFPADPAAKSETWTLPDGFDPFAHGQLTLLADGLGGWLLAARSGIAAPAIAYHRKAASKIWEPLERLPYLACWPMLVRDDGTQIWLVPNIGLIETREDELIAQLAPNPGPQLTTLRGGASMGDTDLLLHRDLGQVWGVGPSAYAPLPSHTHGDVNDAVLALSDAVAAYYRRTGSFPPAIDRVTLIGDVEGSYSWERLWDHFIGGRPLLYEREGTAFDLVVWSVEEGQPIYWLSERGMQELDPRVGFVPAEKRQLGG